MHEMLLVLLRACKYSRIILSVISQFFHKILNKYKFNNARKIYYQQSNAAIYNNT